MKKEHKKANEDNGRTLDITQPTQEDEARLSVVRRVEKELIERTLAAFRGKKYGELSAQEQGDLLIMSFLRAYHTMKKGLFRMCACFDVSGKMSKCCFFDMHGTGADGCQLHNTGGADAAQAK